MPRVSVSASVSFRGYQICGEGKLQNLSLSGLLIVDSTATPHQWTRLQILLLTASGLRLSIDGRVVQHHDNGFAVMFDSLPPQVEGVLRVLLESGSTS